MIWLKKMFGGGATPPPVPAPSLSTGDIRHALPLGLRVHGRVHFDRTMYQVAPGVMTMELPDGHQDIACYGHIDLGDGYAMHRFYLEDDAFLQVLTCGGQVESLQAFVYHGTANPPTKAAFQEFVTGNPHLGAPEIDYDGKRWRRVTSEEIAGKIPPMAFDEVLYRGTPPRRDDDLTNYTCVYARDVPQLDRQEILVVNGEDSGPNEFLVSYAVGVDLNESDLDIT